MRLPLPTLTASRALTQNDPAVIGVLLIVDSLHFVFARFLLPYLPPTVSAMYVLGIATLQVGGFFLIVDHIRFDLFKKYLGYFLTIGFLVAASTALNYSAVAFVDPGTASLLAKSTTLYSLCLGLIWLGERLSRRQIIGAMIAIVGVVIISFQPGDYFRIGTVMILVSTFLYALHAALVKRQREDIRLGEFFLFRLISTTAFLLLFASVRQELVWPSSQAWLFLLLAGTVDVTISRGLYYLALRRLNLSLHALILTLSPVIAIIWTLILFNIQPTRQQVIGGVAVLLGILIVIRQPKGAHS